MLEWFKKVARKIGRAVAAFNDDGLPTFAMLSQNISRERLKRSCRILFIDDEKVELTEDLKKEGFAVEHDQKGDDVSKIERGYFDLVILDYKGVGQKYGDDHGLSLLKAIKRVNPSVYVLAYTSQNLAPTKSSVFYTLCDGTLNKDEGVANSINRIEEALRAAVKPERLWAGVLKSLAIDPGTEKAERMEKRVVKAVLSSKRDDALIALGENIAGPESSLVPALLEKLVTFAVKKYTG